MNKIPNRQAICEVLMKHAETDKDIVVDLDCPKRGKADGAEPGAVPRSCDDRHRSRYSRGKGYTREDHQDVANQLFSCYAKVGDARALASVIGEDELSPLDKTYLKFGEAFEHEFVGQGEEENRTIEETLDKGWELLRMLPREELDRIDTKILDKFYEAPKTAEA